MLREALLLLRRSRGEKSKSLWVRLFAFFALFALFLFGALFLVLALTGVFNAAEQQHLTWLDTEMEHLHNGVSSDYSRLSLRGVALAGTLTADIDAFARENGIDEGTLQSHPDLLEPLLLEQAGNLLAVLDNNVCTGAFIILDATVNPSAENAAFSRAGIFFKRTETNNLSAVTSKNLCLRGPAAVARNSGAELMGQWRMEFDTSGMDFYERVLGTARENTEAELSRLYYWSNRYLMEGDSEYGMLLCVPLIARGGAVYGMCGLEVSAMLFKHLYSPSSAQYPRVFTALAPAAGGALNTGGGLLAGNSYLTSRTTGRLEAGPPRGGVASWQSDDGGVYIGKTEPLRLYPTGSPYAGEAWALGVLMPREDWDATAGRSNLVFYLSLTALLVVSLPAAVFISQRYIRPVVAALELIQTGGPAALPKTQIAEVDDLLLYLAALDEKHKSLGEENENLAAELEDARRRAARLDAPPQEAPVLAAYTRFCQNLGTLTGTERAVFNLYMEDFTAQQIADRLFISKRTVKFHSTNIYAKLGVTSLKELMVYVNMMRETGAPGDE